MRALPGLHDVLQQVVESLAFQLGQRLEQRFHPGCSRFPTIWMIGAVRDVEDEIRSAQKGDRKRRLARRDRPEWPAPASRRARSRPSSSRVATVASSSRALKGLTRYASVPASSPSTRASSPRARTAGSPAACGSRGRPQLRSNPKPSSFGIITSARTRSGRASAGGGRGPPDRRPPPPPRSVDSAGAGHSRACRCCHRPRGCGPGRSEARLGPVPPSPLAKSGSDPASESQRSASAT